MKYENPFKTLIMDYISSTVTSLQSRVLDHISNSRNIYRYLKIRLGIEIIFHIPHYVFYSFIQFSYPTVTS